MSFENDCSCHLREEFQSQIHNRFGALLVPYHQNLLEALQPQLKSPRLAVRKRTIIALGHLVLTCDLVHYAKLINTLLKELTASKGNNLNARTYIQVRNLLK